MRVNKIGNGGGGKTERRDGGTGRIMSRIEKQMEKLFCLGTQNVTV